MIVTRVEKNRKTRSKYDVYIDGEFAFSLVEQDVLYFKIKEGSEIDAEKAEYIKENLVYIAAQDTALNYLSRRMRCTAEVENKLLEKGFAEDTIQKVIEFLNKYGYLDDFKFCRAYIKDCVNLKPKSKFAIKYELKKMGIRQDVIEKAIDESCIDEKNIVCDIIRKKSIKSDLKDEKTRKKFFDSLMRKGFSYELIKQCYEQSLDI